VVFKYLRKLASRTSFKWDDIIISSLKGIILFWFVLTGIYISFSYFNLPQNIYQITQKIITILYVLSATIVITKIISGILSTYLISPSFPTVSIVKITLFVLGFLIILQTLGISITPLLTTLGIGGITIGLALQDTLSNLFSGIYILASKKIRPGDYIKLDSGEEGYVVDITWRETTIKQLPNNIIIIPNSKMSSAKIINYYLPEKELSVLVDVGVSYDSDLEKAEKVTIEVAKEVLKEVPGGVKDFEPFIRYHTFGESSINFTVILRAKEFIDQFLLKHEFIKRLHKRYKKENINIPFPIRTVYLKKEE
jgi:small-conductance mechanosensitive channel